MGTSLPLDRMTTSEKLQALEEIWDDLCRTPEEIAPPSWHGDVLRAREKRVADGTSHFKEWRDAK